MEKRFSWQASILPFIEQDALARRIDWQIAWDDSKNHGAVTNVIQLFLCPAHPGTDLPNSTHYVGLTGIGEDAPLLDKMHPNSGFFGYNRQITTRDLVDGSSQTIAVMESARENGPWAATGNSTLRSLSLRESDYVGAERPFGMKHKTDTFFRSNPVISNALFADGRVQSVPAGVAPEVLRGLTTIAGREEARPDF